MTFANEIKISTNFSKSTSLKESIVQLSVGDFNGDEFPDFFIGKERDDGQFLSSPIILLGQIDKIWTEGTFSVFDGVTPKTLTAGRVAVADFNNDGISDIYFPDWGNHASPLLPATPDTYFLSNNSMNLVQRQIFDVPRKTLTHGYSLGDVNSDGYLDLVVNNLSSSLDDVFVRSDFVFVNDGKGGLIEKSESLLPDELRYSNAESGSHTWSGLIDLNGDSHLDLILGTWDGSDWRKDPSGFHTSFVLNDGSGNFSNSQVYNTPKSPLELEVTLDIDGLDLNRDGYKDIIISTTNGGSNFYRKGYIQILINNKDNTFTDETQSRYSQDASAEGPWWKTVKPVDFNKDGAMDLLLGGAGPLADEQNRAASVLMNDGKGNFTKVFDLPATTAFADSVEVLDVNSDGKLDLVYARQADSAGETASLYALINDFATEVPDGVYDIYRFFNIKTGAHFYTGSAEEKDSVLNSDGFYYEGNVFDSNALQNGEDSTPVYRLYNKINSVHFYTANADEKNTALATGNFNDEGVAYYAFKEDGADREALYRFFNPTTGTHFYTANEAEKIENEANNPGLNYEGVVYYVGGPAPTDNSSALSVTGIQDVSIIEIA